LSGRCTTRPGVVQPMYPVREGPDGKLLGASKSKLLPAPSVCFVDGPRAVVCRDICDSWVRKDRPHNIRGRRLLMRTLLPLALGGACGRRGVHEGCLCAHREGALYCHQHGITDRDQPADQSADRLVAVELHCTRMHNHLWLETNACSLCTRLPSRQVTLLCSGHPVIILTLRRLVPLPARAAGADRLRYAQRTYAARSH
jgi:hypothetical protein